MSNKLKRLPASKSPDSDKEPKDDDLSSLDAQNIPRRDPPENDLPDDEEEKTLPPAEDDEEDPPHSPLGPGSPPDGGSAPESTEVPTTPDWQERNNFYLGLLADYGELSVAEFRDLAELGKPHHPQEAQRVLHLLRDSGLVKSRYRNSKNRYSLTESGEATVATARA